MSALSKSLEVAHTTSLEMTTDDVVTRPRIEPSRLDRLQLNGRTDRHACPATEEGPAYPTIATAFTRCSSIRPPKPKTHCHLAQPQRVRSEPARPRGR